MGILIPLTINSTKFHGKKVLQLKFTENLIPISMHIPVTYLTTWYFHTNFPTNALLAKLPNTSTKGFFIHVTDHSRLLPGGPSSSEGPTVATKVLASC